MLCPRPGHLSGGTAGHAPVSGGIGRALGLVGGTAATVLAAGLGARGHPALGLAPLIVVVLAVAAVTTAGGALGAAAQCWALWDGFLVNRLGELAPTRPGVDGLLMLAVVSLVTTVVASCLRMVDSGLADRRTATVAVRTGSHFQGGLTQC